MSDIEDFLDCFNKDDLLLALSGIRAMGKFNMGDQDGIRWFTEQMVELKVADPDSCYHELDNFFSDLQMEPAGARDSIYLTLLCEMDDAR